MPEESDVARWHRLSGLPDNVTEDGETIHAAPGARLQAEKDSLRAAIARIREHSRSPDARAAARLAASYLLAGDVDTAHRYLAQAEERAHSEGAPNAGAPNAGAPNDRPSA